MGERPLSTCVEHLTYIDTVRRFCVHHPVCKRVLRRGPKSITILFCKRKHTKKRNIMDRTTFGEMLVKIREAVDANLDPQDVVNSYRKNYKYAYVYNDAIVKTLLGTKKHERLAIDFLNAALKLDGADCIKSLHFMNTENGSELGTKRTNSDIITDWNEDRIVLEFQHEGNDNFADRLVYYTSRNTIPLLHPGNEYYLSSLYTVAIQMFNLPIYKNDKNYLHSIRLTDENGKVFYDKQVLKLVEVKKFLEGENSWDNSRLAQWLRAIDAINNEEDRIFDDPIFADLQKAAELCNFDALYYCTEAKATMDYEYEMRIQVKRESAEQAKILAKDLAKDMAQDMAKDMAQDIARDMAQDIAKGMVQNMTKDLAQDSIRELVAKNLRKGKDPQVIADMLETPLSEVLEIQKKLNS